ncbi:MAG: tetratricopeptide repeat protein [Candidatus Zixiibacteriota bacterium]
MLKLTLVITIVMLLVGSVAAEKARKLPAKAYIQSAKIEILGYGESKEEARIKLAQAMLDSLFLYWGPHSEGYYWYSQIKWDLAKEKANLKDRLPLVAQAIAYADSLAWTCGNDQIKKDYRKDCDKLDEQLDSVRVHEWREYYNDGVNQITEVEQQMEAVKVETDSAALAYYQTRLDAIIDSCQDNMAIAIVIDSTDVKPFIGLATVNERTGKYDKAIEYLMRALPLAADRTQILTSIAYDYVQMNDYCASIPWFREYIDLTLATPAVLEDAANRDAVVGTAHNLAICYNNCKEYDSAYATFGRILEINPEDVTALVGAARYQQHYGRLAGDSSRASREAGNEAASKNWQGVRDQRFDSARVFLKRAFELSGDDAAVASEYGLMAAILQKMDEAKVAFTRATELAPDEVDYWVSLGDCNLQMRDFPGAATAYEKVVEFRPDDKAVWERLAELYEATGNKARRAEVLEKLKTL